MVRFNGERLKLYDNNHLTIVDAALAAGFPNEQIFPKRGTAINFTVNGAARIARGEAGEAAVVTMNGKPAHINTPLEPNSEIVIEPSTTGEKATYTISQLEEFTSATVGFVVNGKMVTCPKFVQVNGSLEPGSYEIQEGDVIETRNFYTVGQVAEFMDVEVDRDREILVNNREADFDTLVYENFSIEWTVLSFGVADAPYEAKAPQETKVPTGMNLPEGVENLSGNQEEHESNVVEETPASYESAYEPTASQPVNAGKEIIVFVNGEPVPLTGKEEYIFVDIFDRITFDLTQSRGRAIATLVNGREAQFTEVLSHGDKVDLYWKEN